MDWIVEQFGWMQWNWPSAIFFVSIIGSIVGFTVWDIVTPGVPRRGVFPIPTTRGDRLFIGIMLTLGVFLLWLAIVGNNTLWVAVILAVLVNAAIARWG